MVDITTFTDAVASLKAVKDIAETMIALGNGKAFQSKLSEFQSKLINAQTAIFAVNEERTALINRVSQLEKEVAQLEAWSTEKEKYELINLLPNTPDGNGVFAYIRKESAQPTEAGHKICSNCYQNGKKSILQLESRVPGMDKVLICTACRSEIYIIGARHSKHAKPRQ